MSMFRGYSIHEKADGEFYFDDNHEPVALTWGFRPCGHCGKHNSGPQGQYDGCLGEMPGVVNACCGHGKRSSSYICFENGITIRGFTID